MAAAGRNATAEFLQPDDGLSDSAKVGPNEGISATDFDSAPSGERSGEATPPPLPPRPKTSVAHQGSASSLRSLRPSTGASRPPLRGQATTALSVGDVHTLSHGVAPQDSRSTPASRQASAAAGYDISRSGSDNGDSASVRSFAPALEVGADLESILGDVVVDREGLAWKPTVAQTDAEKLLEAGLFFEDEDFERAFAHEFDELEQVKEDGSNESEGSTTQ